MKRLVAVVTAVTLLSACASAPPAQPVLQTEQPVSAAPLQAPAPKLVEWPDAVLYFVVLDRFADGSTANNANVDISAKGTFHGGDLAGLTQQLDEIASLGVTALWITPVVDNIDSFVTGAGFPDWGYHGYWADDFTKLDPRFGTEAELKTLVDEAHRRGIRVLLDVVYNHAGYNSKYLTNPKTKLWLRSNENGTCGSDDITSCVSGLPDFKTELAEVRDYLFDAHLSLARRVGLDGFRLDTVKHVTHDFWREHRQRVDAELGPDFFLLGEVWGGDAQSLDPWFAGDEMDGGFDFSFQGSTLGWLQGRGRTVAFDRYLKSREKVRAGYLLSHFLSSHDVRGALNILEGDKQLFRLAALLQFMTAGLPMIYYGEEVGRPGGDWPDNRSDMPWGTRNIAPGSGKPRDEALRADYAKLISIRKAHPALSRGRHTTVSTEGDLLVFSRVDEASGDEVIVAVNRGSEPAALNVTVPERWQAASVTDAWTGEHFPVTGGSVQTTVAGRSARVITR
ncbi:MAG TPA: alpha-amylase family glycosyl hydrolase [Thermoanaerobaculia bacterium]|nr:alpha-amylase family glycosyl hydrolase [Thermoanaerobaculia bacterium]